MPSTLKEQYRQQIENEIRPLESRLLRLRADINALAPVSCLPVELLSRIFQLVVDWELDDVQTNDEQVLRRRLGQHARKDRYRLQWISICHVCRAWRTVALTCAVLWRRPFFFNAELTKLMLARSRDAELDILACSYHGSLTHTDTQALRLVAPHMRRVRKVDIVLSDVGLHEFLNGAIDVPAPRLRYLSLQSFHSFRISARNLTLRLPSDIFQSNAPNLRTLRLRGWGVDWDSPLLTMLTHLELQSVPARWRATVDEIVSALARLPSLERLGLASATRASADSEAPGAPPAALPRLAKLMLRDEIGVCLALLERLAVPPGIPLSISCVWTPGTSQTVARLMQAVVRHFSADGARRPPLHTVHLWLLEGKVGQLKAWRARGAEAGEDAPDTGAPADLAVTFQRVVDLMECGMHQLPLAAVRKFTLVGLQDPRRQEIWPEEAEEADGRLDEGWGVLLTSLTGLRTFEVVGTAVRMEEVFESLRGFVRGAEGLRREDDERVVLPCLQRVGVSFAVIGHRDFACLLRMCEERRERGAPLRELVVHQCATKGWDMRLAQAEEVEWDGCPLTVDQAFSRFYEVKEWDYHPVSRLHEDFLENW
ncbi:hypothetical protein GLOTRDRAFT_134903 [Gloeophyllum trabeum ATCC 11539]|uniref:Uncharacterized protein n=1 Tax=Gloeophyllum trabeum (strain ATCC 11539 / FP-39264 / Madison 617) TaxID=670483 RepID=S7QLD8_GLOTA|nr:uncharacterized protein GLOTRDRAFT_134903 [Gloeophyllum trabeum ATCC 11539]EPQ60163.1 hypothetical protein GLOTRDRAFT_134903 [Gloeophyllum trabeum ATCC 11539]